MKARFLVMVSALALVMSSTGSDCIRSPFTVSVNLGPMEGCYDVQPGDTTWGIPIAPIPISDLIDDNFEDNIVEFRLYDVRVKVSDNFPEGNISGTVWYAFDTPSPLNFLLTFAGPSSSFQGEGASILEQAGVFTVDPDVLVAFIGALNNSATRPEFVVLSSIGSGPPAPTGRQVCVDIYVQADATVE